MGKNSALMVWKGSKDLHLQADSPEFFSQGDTEGYTLVYEGPYKTCMAKKPTRGGTVPGYAGYYVSRVQCRPKGNGADGIGTLTVTIESDIPGGTSSPVDETVIEIDAGRIERPLLSFEGLAELTAAEAKAIRDAVEAGQTIPNASIPGPVTDAQQAFYDALKKGQESYVDAAPTVTKTTYSYTRPTVGRIGRGTRTATKPDPAAPDGYIWLKTGDKAIRQGRKGKWERIEIWEAADDWSEFFYDEP